MYKDNYGWNSQDMNSQFHNQNFIEDAQEKASLEKNNSRPFNLESSSPAGPLSDADSDWYSEFMESKDGIGTKSGEQSSPDRYGTLPEATGYRPDFVMKGWGPEPNPPEKREKSKRPGIGFCCT